MRRWYAASCLTVLLAAGLLSLQRYAAPPGPGGKDCVVHDRPVSRQPAVRPVTVAPPAFLVQRGGTVDDASCLNRTGVYGVARPRDEREVRQALAFAREHGLKVAVSGTRHGLGGQATAPGGLILDMRDLASVTVTGDTVRVGAGAVWRDVLERLHEHGRSVRAMPSIDVLSVGGTVSVDAHGADFRTGSLASTVRSLRLVRADGTVTTLDRRHSPELFRAVIGGYGLFGVILDVELETVPDEMYRFDQRVVRAADFADVYARDVVADDSARLMWGHLSTSPGSLLEEAILYTYRSTGGDERPGPPLRDEQGSAAGRLMFNLARHGGLWQRAKWAGQKQLLPRLRRCTDSRNEALRAAEACLVSRDQALYNGLGLLENRLTEFTDVLQEYFLPADQLAPFLAEARDALRRHDAVLMSASIRAVHEGEAMLSYAPGDRLSVVLYLSQRTTAAGNRDMAALDTELLGRALARGGSFYLPYQQHYTAAQLRSAYPMLDAFFALKRAVDPGELFSNSLYTRYA